MFPLHAAFAFETGLFMNSPQITLIWCQQFPAGTLIDTMVVITACLYADGNDEVERENLMMQRQKNKK